MQHTHGYDECSTLLVVGYASVRGACKFLSRTLFFCLFKIILVFRDFPAWAGSIDARGSAPRLRTFPSYHRTSLRQKSPEWAQANEPSHINRNCLFLLSFGCFLLLF